MDCRHEPRGSFCCLSRRAGRIVHLALGLLLIARGGALIYRNSELLDETRGEISVLFP